MTYRPANPRRGLLFLFLLTSAATASAQPTGIAYELSMPEPWTHIFQVEMRITDIPSSRGEITLEIPAWRSGRYQIFDFASGIVRIAASDQDGKPLPIVKRAKGEWRVSLAGARALAVRYAVFANEFQQRTRGLNTEHGFVDGSAVFLYTEEYRRLPIRLTVKPYGAWHVTTGLDSLPGERFTFTAPSYDHLIDCPLEIGIQRDTEMIVEGIPHVISVFGPLDCDMDSLAADVRRIVKINREFWGTLPYRRYVFLFEVFPGGGGGTEHINSTVMQVGPPKQGSVRHWRELVGLVSHEYFHTWNVKQLRPKGMDPYDWRKEVYFKELWVAEGGTSYFHGLLLRRAGFNTARQFLDGLASGIAADRERPGNTAEALVDCSFDAWLQGRVSPEASFNYKTDFYGRGSSVCALLDLEIRQRSNNAHSLDDVLRLLYKRFPLGSGGYTVEDLRNACTELAKRSVDDLFEEYVYGAGAIPWERLLGYAGLRLEPSDTAGRPWLGLDVGEEGGMTVVRRVVAGSPASNAGIVTGDEILAIDGKRVAAAELKGTIEGRPLSSRVRVTYFHETSLKQADIVLSMPAPKRYVIHPVEAPSPLQRSIAESWLGARWDGELAR